MDELANPYRPGAGTAPPALVGRDGLVNSFGVTARRALAGRPGRSLVAVGLRGVGKTVLLNRFCQIAEQEGFSVGFIEAGESGDLRVALAARLRRMLLRLERTGADTVLRALRVLKTFSAQLPDGTRLSLDVDALRGYADSGDLSEDITDLLVAAGEAAGSRGRGILLAVDEVQYLSRAELGALITAIHRTTQLELPVTLVGAGLPNLPSLAGAAKTYAERLFEFPVVGALSEADSRAALLIPAHAMGVEIDADALQQVVRASGGYPYFLQEWGYRLWNAAQASPIGAADVARAEPAVRQHLDGTFFRIRYDRLTAKEKQYLQAMAALGPGPHRVEDVAERLGVRPESVAPRRSALIGKGMIYAPSRGMTGFTVALFDQFLRRAATRDDT